MSFYSKGFLNIIIFIRIIIIIIILIIIIIFNFMHYLDLILNIHSDLNFLSFNLNFN